MQIKRKTGNSEWKYLKEVCIILSYSAEVSKDYQVTCGFSGKKANSDICNYLGLIEISWKWTKKHREQE